MFKKLICIACVLFFVTAQALENTMDTGPSPTEDLTSYVLKEKDLLELKETLDACIRTKAKYLAYLATTDGIYNETPFMQNFNSMSRKDMTEYVFFALTNSETRPYIDAILQDKAKAHLFRYILIYLERDLELEMVDFDLLRKNTSELARLLALDEIKIKNYLDQKNYSELFLYLTHIDHLFTLKDEEEEDDDDETVSNEFLQS